MNDTTIANKTAKYRLDPSLNRPNITNRDGWRQIE